MAWRVCANGSVLRTEIGGDSTLWHFKTTPPLPPYLFAVVAGRYDAVERKHGDIPMAIWCRDSLATWIDQQADEIFEITASGIDFFEQYFAMTYPFDEYNQIFVPELKFGAMENPGCVIFNENRIHRGQATEVQLQVCAETILHEMAHARLRRRHHHALVGRPVAQRDLRDIQGLCHRMRCRKTSRLLPVRAPTSISSATPQRFRTTRKCRRWF
jgi:hypothetical protein